MIMIANKNGYRLKCDTPNEPATIDHLHSGRTLVNLSTEKYPNAFACASGTGRVRGELGRPSFICFLLRFGGDHFPISLVMSGTST